MIRPMGLDDIEAVKVLAWQAYQETPDLWPFGIDTDFMERQLFTQPSYAGFVHASDEGDLDGIILMQMVRFPFAPVACLALVFFYVTPKARGIVPKRLLVAAEDWGRTNGAKVFQISTLGGSHVKRHTRFFSGMGYSVSGITALKAL